MHNLDLYVKQYFIYKKIDILKENLLFKKKIGIMNINK